MELWHALYNNSRHEFSFDFSNKVSSNPAGSYVVNRHRFSIKEMRYECSVRQLLVEIETVSRELNRDTEYEYLLGEREVLEMKNAVLAGTLTLSPLKIVVVENSSEPLFGFGGVSWTAESFFFYLCRARR